MRAAARTQARRPRVIAGSGRSAARPRKSSAPGKGPERGRSVRSCRASYCATASANRYEMRVSAAFVTSTASVVLAQPQADEIRPKRAADRAIEVGHDRVDVDLVAKTSGEGVAVRSDSTRARSN